MLLRYIKSKDANTAGRSIGNSANGVTYISALFENKIIHGFRKYCNAAYPVQLAIHDVIMSADYRLSLGAKAAEVLLIVDENSKITGTFSIELADFTSVEQTQELLTTQALAEAGFTQSLAASLFRWEDDLHPGNIGKKAQRIDFGLSGYNRAAMIVGYRFVHYIPSFTPKFKYTNEFFEHFPDLEAANVKGPCFWPTYSRAKNFKGSRVYRNYKNFIALKLLDSQLKTTLTAYLKELLISANLRKFAYSRYLSDENLFQPYIADFELEKKELHNALFSKEFKYKELIEEILTDKHCCAELLNITLPLDLTDDEREKLTREISDKLLHLRLEIFSEKIADILQSLSEAIKNHVSLNTLGKNSDESIDSIKAEDPNNLANDPIQIYNSLLQALTCYLATPSKNRLDDIAKNLTELQYFITGLNDEYSDPHISDHSRYQNLGVY